MIIIEPKIVPKVWGEERWICNNPLYCGKYLIIHKGMRCSLHQHPIKHETFHVVEGAVLMEVEDNNGINRRTFMPGDTVEIRPGLFHRFTGIKNSIILEFSTHHEDDDTVRLEPSGAAP